MYILGNLVAVFNLANYLKSKNTFSRGKGCMIQLKSLLEETLGPDMGANHEERVGVHDGQHDVYDELGWFSVCNFSRHF